MSTSRHVCDGWDASVTLASGERVTLHFGREPSEADIAATAAAYEQATAAKPEEETTTVEVECEDGTYA